MILTTVQQKALDTIREHIERTGSSPTRAEIAQAMGYRSANAAEEMVRRLSIKGVITVTPGTSRGIQIVQQRRPTMQLTMVEIRQQLEFAINRTPSGTKRNLLTEANIALGEAIRLDAQVDGGVPVPAHDGNAGEAAV
jgi:SOS-response transcriptional repressor LexA